MIETIPVDNEFIKVEKRTFKLHLISQFLNGISFGILLMQDVILKKSLAATDFEVTLLMFLTSSSFLFSIYGLEIINRAHDQSKVILIIGVFSKLFLFIIPFVELPYYFIFCIAAMSYSDSLGRPYWNVVYRHNYSESKRNKFFSYATSLYTAALLIIVVIFGRFLDVDYKVYKIFFPLAGLCDIIAYVNLAKMVAFRKHVHAGFREKIKGKLNGKLIRDILILPLRSTKKIFAENPAFFRFETAFFIYGSALMILSPVIPIYLVQTLNLGYTPISNARGFVFHSAIILFTPLMGMFERKLKPARFCGYLFLVLTLYPLGLIWIEFVPAFTIFALNATFFIYGLCMSGINLAWALSSIHYSPPLQVANYQAVHITLTGIRGVFSPFLGFIILNYFSLETVFLTCAVLFIVSGILMFKYVKNK
jgi:hypothetical protein